MASPTNGTPKFITVILWILVSVNALTLIFGCLITWLSYIIPVRLKQMGLAPGLAVGLGLGSLMVAMLGICALNYSSHNALNIYGLICSLFIVIMLPGIIPNEWITPTGGVSSSGKQNNGNAQPPRTTTSLSFIDVPPNSPGGHSLLLSTLHYSLLVTLVVLVIFALVLAQYFRRKETRRPARGQSRQLRDRLSSGGTTSNSQNNNNTNNSHYHQLQPLLPLLQYEPTIEYSQPSSEANGYLVDLPTAAATNFAANLSAANSSLSMSAASSSSSSSPSLLSPPLVGCTCPGYATLNKKPQQQQLIDAQQQTLGPNQRPLDQWTMGLWAMKSQLDCLGFNQQQRQLVGPASSHQASPLACSDQLVARCRLADAMPLQANKQRRPHCRHVHTLLRASDNHRRGRQRNCTTTKLANRGLDGLSHGSQQQIPLLVHKGFYWSDSIGATMSGDNVDNVSANYCCQQQRQETYGDGAAAAASASVRTRTSSWTLPARGARRLATPNVDAPAEVDTSHLFGRQLDEIELVDGQRESIQCPPLRQQKHKQQQQHRKQRHHQLGPPTSSDEHNLISSANFPWAHGNAGEQTSRHEMTRLNHYTE